MRREGRRQKAEGRRREAFHSSGCHPASPAFSPPASALRSLPSSFSFLSSILYPLFSALYLLSSAFYLLSFIGPPAFAVELPYRNEATRQLLIQALQDEDRVTRVRAAVDLATFEVDRNREALAGLASDPVETVRRAALSPARGEAPSLQASEDMTLKAGFNPRPRVEDPLITETHRDSRVRQVARLRKLESDPTCQEDFSKLIDDPDYFVRRAVSVQVVKKRGPASLTTWRKILTSEKLADLVEAAWAVGQLDSRSDEPVLLNFLASNSERLRLISIASLDRIGGDASRQALVAAIPKYTAKTQEALLRLAAHLEARTALPVIRELAGDKKAALASRLLAIDAIRTMSDGEAKPILLRMAVSYGCEPGDSELREHAVGALGVVGGPEAVVPLRKLITEKVILVPIIGPCYDNDSTRAACIQALQKLKEVNTLNSLTNEKFMAESSEFLRRTMAETLSAVTGTTYDYRRSASFGLHFIENLDPEEYPPALAENLKKPPIFPVSP